MHFTTLPSILLDKSSLSPEISAIEPQSLMSLCSWWERTHAKTVPLPHICHEFTSPDKLLTSYMAPPMQYNFARLAADMLETAHSDGDMVEVEHAVHDTGRSIGLVGISLGVLFILFTIAFISCMKRKKTVLTDHVHPHHSVDTQVRITLGTGRHTREEDIPPAYSLVVRVKEEEDQDLPTYLQAVGGHHDTSGEVEGDIESAGEKEEKEEVSEYNQSSSYIHVNHGAADIHDDYK